MGGDGDASGVLSVRAGPRKRVAIVGGGAAGLMTAWLLQSEHDVALYERSPFLGGHARTIRVDCDGVTVPCETGFKYFFADNYPTLLSVLAALGLKPTPAPLSLTVTLRDGATLVLPPRTPGQVLGLAASPRRLFGLIGFERLLRSGGRLLEHRDWSLSLAQYVDGRGLSRAWAEEFVYPTLAANWGVSVSDVVDFPAYSVLKVLSRYRGAGHRFLELEGGVSSYVDRLVGRLNRVALRPGIGVSRFVHLDDGRVRVEDDRGGAATFDDVVLATSARDAARMLAGVPRAARWREVLGRFRHFDTTIAIHGDPSFMPARREDWSMINVFHERDRASWQTEWAGRREGASVFRTWLRPDDPRPERLHWLQSFHHLIVTPESEGLHRRIADLQGEAGLWAVGMYTTDVDNHESALASAVLVARALAARSRREATNDWPASGAA